MSRGFVSLVGAGPGDRELISLKGWQRLKDADVVFYDYLVNERLLNACQENSPTIYVGKSADEHHYTQDKINEVLVNEAQQGKRIVRLKGGDPFVFGRGSEEILSLKEAGIPFEIIPGITAAVAGPTYAGVPLTHRGLSLSCTFVTGHESKDRPLPQTDWNNLADNRNTLIFYMGMKNISSIVQNLIQQGRPANSSAIVIQNGSFGIQRSVEGNLDNIIQKVKESKLTSPALILVGAVSELRESLKWFENLPLFGKTLGWVGKFHSHEKELDHVESLGAHVIELPILSSQGETREPRFRAKLLIKRHEVQNLAFDSLESYQKLNKTIPLSKEWLQHFTLGSTDKRVIEQISHEQQLNCTLIDKIDDFLKP